MSGERIADGDLLFRRFDPNDVSHWATDESTGEGRVRSGALTWDPREGTTPAAQECSVYQSSKIYAAGHDHTLCLEKPDWKVAAVDPEIVRTIKRPTVPEQPNPFDAVEDEYPTGEEGAHDRDAAHAGIVHDAPLKGASRWYSELAKEFTVVEETAAADVDESLHPDEDAPPASELHRADDNATGTGAGA